MLSRLRSARSPVFRGQAMGPFEDGGFEFFDLVHYPASSANLFRSEHALDLLVDLTIENGRVR